MARFTASFAHVFTRPQPRRERSPAPIVESHATVLDDLEQAPRGPGWFDSSWDLQCGLEVREGLPGDAQLHEWIESCLRSGPAAPALALLAAGATV